MRLPAALALAALALLAGRAWADEFRLELPVDCRPGVDCFVQNYVDTDPGPGARDFTCGPLSYDGHTGTDIRVASLAEMQAGVAVLAAAPGRVVGTRDGMFDSGLEEMDPTGPGVNKCGNGVWLRHAGGWITQYCHMKRGSIVVERGDEVAVGQRLGEIGLSGRTEFPHLHLNVVRGRDAVDPYTGRGTGGGCGARTDDAPLWSEAALERLAYRASGLLGAGFGDGRVEWDEIKRGGLRHRSLPADAPALVFWVEVFGVRAGDREHLRLLAPDGRVLAAVDGAPQEKPMAVQFRFAGKRLTGEAWPAGEYTGLYRLLRRRDDTYVETLRVARTLAVR